MGLRPICLKPGRQVQIKFKSLNKGRCDLSICMDIFHCSVLRKRRTLTPTFLLCRIHCTAGGWGWRLWPWFATRVYFLGLLCCRGWAYGLNWVPDIDTTVVFNNGTLVMGHARTLACQGPGTLLTLNFPFVLSIDTPKKFLRSMFEQSQNMWSCKILQDIAGTDCRLKGCGRAHHQMFMLSATKLSQFL